MRIVSFSTRTSISPVASLGLTVPSGRRATLPVDRQHVFAADGFGQLQILGAAFRAKHDLRLAVAVAQVDEQHAAVIAVGIDPAAKGDFGRRDWLEARRKCGCETIDGPGV